MKMTIIINIKMIMKIINNNEDDDNICKTIKDRRAQKAEEETSRSARTDD